MEQQRNIFANIRGNLEKGFILFGHFLCKRRWYMLFFCCLLAGIMLIQLPKIRYDTSAEGLLHPDDPALLDFNTFREQFGTDQSIIALLQPGEIFAKDFLAKLVTLHAELESIDNVEDVRSLVNTTSIWGNEDEIFIEELLHGPLPDDNDILALRKKVLANPLYINAVISQGGDFTTITIRPVRFQYEKTSEGAKRRRLSEEETTELLNAVEAVCNRYRTPEFPIFLGGVITAEEALKRLTQETLNRFTALTGLLILIVLAVLFRRVSGVIIPLIIVNISLFCTLGLMAAAGIPFTINTTILPSILLAVGIGDSVHLLAVFYLHYGRTGKKEEAIAYALGHSGLAVVMTSLTTAAGFFSFVSAGIAPVANLGIFAAIGVMLALFFSLVLLPVLLSITPIKVKHVAESEGTVKRLDLLLTSMGDFAVRQPRRIVTVFALLLTASLLLALQLRFSHNSLLYMPEDHPVRKAVEIIDAKMKGSIAIEVMIDTGREFGLYDPIVMETMERMAQHAEGIKIGDQFPGKAGSVAEIIKDINRALHEGRQEFYRIPEHENLLAQELLLFQNSAVSDLDRLLDFQLSKARLTIMVPWVDAVIYADILEELEEDFKTMLAGRAEVTITGISAIICRTFTQIIRTMGRSYIIAAGVITLLMLLLIGNIRIGLLSMVPNLLPIIMGLGFMKIASIPLDYSTIMVGGITIGLAVDDTIHYFHNFRRYYDHTGDVSQAVRQTMLTTGRAMLFTTIILGVSFFFLLNAELKSTANFGLITGFTIVMALVADFFLAPALLVLALPKNKWAAGYTDVSAS